MCMAWVREGEHKRARDAKPIASRADVWPTSFFGPLQQHPPIHPSTHPPHTIHPPARRASSSRKAPDTSRLPNTRDCPCDTCRHSQATMR